MQSEQVERGWMRRVARRLAVAMLIVLVIGFVTTRVLVAIAESEHPRLGTTIEVAGSRHHYVDRGKGPPIVLVHGAFGASQDFVATILPELSTRYRCIAWDRPGHGYSERPARDLDPGAQARILFEFLDALELGEPPLLVGFSYGGAVVLSAGLIDPESVRGVVLLNGPSHPWPDPLDFQYELPTVPILGPLVVETVLMPFGLLASHASVEAAFSPRPVAEAFEESSPIALSLRPASYRANAEDIRLLKPFLRAQSAHYESYAAPLTLLVAEGDLVVSPTIHSPALVEAVPAARMIRLADAGHQILYTDPDVVIQAIDEALSME